MQGEGEKAGLISDEDIADWIAQSRRKEDSHEGDD